MNQSIQRLQRQISSETVTFDPHRGSIFRKPSFLNIDDDFGEVVAEDAVGGVEGRLSSAMEDSFLILERGKESLDIWRSSENDLQD